MTSLSISGVQKRYGDEPVLRGIDLDVANGSLTAILGPSGSGKTTLLRIIAGFDRADAGRIELGDLVVDDGRRTVRPERRRVGYVPQEGALFPHLSVAANVGFGLRRGQRRGAKVADLLAMVGLAGLGDRYPHQISGGQQQRVALARALAVSPALVLLDEPFASLDASLRASVRADVQQVLRDAGTTAVLVTHDQDEALSIADQVAVIRDGRICQSAAPRTLYTHPVDAELARFLGDANLLRGTIDGAFATTTLGTHELRDVAAVSAPTPALVLVRPEQIDIRASGSRTGGGVGGRVGARVLRSEYHGHDTVVTVCTDAADRETDMVETIVVRTNSGRDLEPDMTVTVAVEGAVLAWPDPSEEWRHGG